MVKVEASAAGPLPSPALLWCFRRPGHAAQAQRCRRRAHYPCRRLRLGLGRGVHRQSGDRCVGHRGIGHRRGGHDLAPNRHSTTTILLRKPLHATLSPPSSWPRRPVALFEPRLIKSGRGKGSRVGSTCQPSAAASCQLLVEHSLR